MSIIIRKTKKELNEKWPAIYSWFPCKEPLSAITHTKIVDYALGKVFASNPSVNIDKALAYAVRAPGNSAAGADFIDATGVGTDFSVAADEHFIALACGINLDIAASYLYYGRATGTATIKFTEGGTAEVGINGHTYTDTAARTASSTVCYIGYNRTTGFFQFGGVTSGPAIVALRTVDGAAEQNSVMNFGLSPASNGVAIYNGAAAANPCGLYGMIIAKFKGTYPTYTSGFDSELLQWRADCLAGSKNRLPAFLKGLTV